MNKIETKIKDFISKLYLYKALEGFIVFVLFFGFYFFIYLIVEYFFYLDSFTRTSLFYFTALLALVFFAHKILYPILQSFIPSLQISKENASRIIGSSNSEINDRLLNLLQLENLVNDELVSESIHQLEKDLFVFDFIKAINFQNLRLFFKLLLLPISFFIIISIINFEGIIVEPSNRIISFNEKFDKPLDFKIQILNDDLIVVEGEDFKLNYKVIPNSSSPLFIFIGDDVFEVNNLFSSNTHSFNNVKSNLEFRIGETKTKSYSFNLKLIYPPKVNSLKLLVIPPKYTKLPSKEITSISDVHVAEGSALKWLIESSNVSQIIFKSDSSKLDFDVVDNLYSFPLVAYKSFDYTISISSTQLEGYVSLDYIITTISDVHPKLNVDILETTPSILGINSFVFSASDDYGLTKYGYQVLMNGKVLKSKYLKTSRKKLSNKRFNVDTRDMKLSGEAVIRFFVSDNDKIHGSKTSYSSNFPIQIFTNEDLAQEHSIQKDSLVDDFSAKLEKQIKLDSLNNNSSDFQQKKQSEQEKLEELKFDLEKSLKQKKELLKNLNSINDEEMLKEIEEAIKAQEELLKEINEALKENVTEKNTPIKSDELKAKNDFQQKKTLNLLRKIASSQMLKSLTKDAKKLDESVEKLSEQPSSNEMNSLKDQVSKLEEKLEKYSKLKGSEELKKDLKKDIDELKKESSKSSISDKDKMKKNSKKILSKLQSESSMSGGGGESMSVDLELLNYLFHNYLSSSYDEEVLIVNYDISSLEDHNKQYNILSRLSFLNSSLYNFAIENEHFTRASFDLIYPLQQYQDRFNDVYESGNSFKLDQVQREMLSDVNSVTDLLSDIIEQMNNADANASGEGEDGNERKGGTPQDLIDLQKQLNSQSDGKQEGEGEDGDQVKHGKGEGGEQLSDEEISDIIKKQEEIRNRYNELNGGSKSEMDKEVKLLKKALLKHKSKTEVERHQNNILKFLKDFKGESKEKEKKRKSKVGKQINNGGSSYDLTPDLFPPTEEDLRRHNLDFNEFYNNKINKK